MLKEGMKIEARHVRRKQLSQYIDINHLKRERKVSESLNNSSSATQLAKKRLSAEMGQLNSSSKRNKLNESVSLVCSKDIDISRTRRLVFSNRYKLVTA
jgi:hypothetical protein